MSVNKISEAILGVGVDDTTIDLFESQYPVPTGVSYNSYVILDEKTAVLDTVCLLYTSGLAYNGIILRLHAKLSCMFRDVVHRADHILQRRIVGSLHAEAVAQHEHRIAQCVQVPCSGNALADLRTDHNRITADHQRIFLVCLRPFCRQIIQFHTGPAGIPVSYTHLDVYKRQVSFPPKQD